MGYIKVSKAYLFFGFGLIPASVGYGSKITLLSERTVLTVTFDFDMFCREVHTKTTS